MSNLQRFVAGEDPELVGVGRRCDQDDGAGRGVLRVERSRRRSDTRARIEPMRTTANRRASALLALRARRVRLDRRLDGGAAARLPAGRRARPRCARQASTRSSRCRRGRRSRRPVAARARRPPPVHRRRRRLGRSAVGRPRSTARGRLLASRKLVGVRHIVQAEPDDFLARPDVPARHRAARATSASPTTSSSTRGSCRGPIEFARGVSAAALRARSSRQAGHPRAARFDEWRAASAPARRAAARLRQAVGPGDRGGLARRGRRSSCGRISTPRSSAFGPDRLMIGSDWPVCTVAGDTTRTMAW